MKFNWKNVRDLDRKELKELIKALLHNHEVVVKIREYGEAMVAEVVTYFKEEDNTKSKEEQI